jgi:polyisoprenoid-binding protein YceI
MKKLLISTTIAAASLFSNFSYAADYNIDKEGAHAFINFKIQHLGYSWLTGRFNDFDGKFSYDQSKANDSKINVVIQTASIDSNHAERDKHLRGKDFLDVEQYPTATFTSTQYKANDEKSGMLTGEFTLHGVTKTISFPVTKVGEGEDPWGGYRAGFTGSTTLKLTDYGIDYNLGPASTHVELELHIEGVRQ